MPVDAGVAEPASEDKIEYDSEGESERTEDEGEGEDI